MKQLLFDYSSENGRQHDICVSVCLCELQLAYLHGNCANSTFVRFAKE